jgi:cysteine desulfurase
VAYFDHNATTPMHREVLDAMLPFLTSDYGNASSLHGPGRAARAAVEAARAAVGKLIGASADEVIFTGSGTESDNLAILGACRAARARGNHVICSSIEHHAVLGAVESLRGEGFHVTVLPVAPDGRLTVETVAAALTPQTVLVSVMHANNESGIVQPVPDIGAMVRPRGILFHTDAVQSVGKIPVDVGTLQVDLLSLSGHKIHGPKGVGALYVRSGTPMQCILHGGGQEEGRRPGTYNVAGIVGLGHAAELARRSRGEDAGYVASLADRLSEGLWRRVDGAVILGGSTERLPNTLLVCFPGCDNEALIANLDLQGISVSSGAACNAGQSTPSHVLRAMGVPDELARGAVRFSLGSGNTAEEVDRLLEAVEALVARRPGWTGRVGRGLARAFRREEGGS